MTRTFFFLSIFISLPTLAAPCTSLIQQENLRLWSCDRTKVLVVKGTPEQKAEAHGRLLGKELSKAPFDQFADLLLSGVKDSPVAHWFADKALGVWTWLYDRKAPESYHKELKALAAGAGIPANRARRALMFPDTALFYWSMLEGPFAHLGCSSAARKFPDGRFASGRNLDFMGVGAFDEHQLMIVSLPAEGSQELKHLIFGADGMPFGGLTGMNEAGISFTVHQNYTRDANLGGVPMPYIGELVLREAKTLDEAVEIIKKNRPGPLWTFILTDLKAGVVRAIEVSQKHFSVREMEDGMFAQSNHSFHEAVRADELIDVGTKTNSVWRTERAMALMKEAKASVDGAELMAKFLAEAREDNGEMAIHEEVIKPLTIQSVILERKTNGEIEASLSMDGAPTSSGRFATFSVEKLWGALSSEKLEAQIRNLSGTSAARRAKQVATAKAFAASMEPDGIPKALKILEEQTSTSALLVRSIYQRKQDRADESLKLVEQARAGKSFAKEPKYIKQAFDWVELASLYKLRRHDEEKVKAKAILASGPIDPHLKTFAEDLAAGRGPNKEEADLDFDFFSGYISELPAKPEFWKGLDPRSLFQP